MRVEMVDVLYRKRLTSSYFLLVQVAIECWRWKGKRGLMQQILMMALLELDWIMDWRLSKLNVLSAGGLARRHQV